MAYIGNTVQNQGFTPAIDYFSGNGSTVTFTLSRPLVSVAQVIAVIENVPQNPSTAFTVTGNSITFTSAPPSGTNNIWVEYTSLITQYNAISQDPSVIGDITASGGFLATGDFGNTFTDGTIVDYVTGNARITTGPSDGITLYNNGPSSRNALMTLTAAGNVGIGTSSPNYKVGINGSATAFTQYTNSSTGTTTTDGLLIGNDGTGAYIIQRENDFIAIWTNNTERARLDANGNFLLAGNNPSQSVGNGIKLLGAGGGSGIPTMSIVGNQSSSGQGSYHLYSSSLNQYQFYVTYDGTISARNTSINGLSDIREKTNVKDIDTGLDTVIALKPRRFDWKNGSGANVAGFIAQEVELVLPELVGEYKISDEETRKSLRMGDMLPTLVKAIQEQQAIIEDLKARIETLEAK